ncbi:hypothetical protein A2954_00330 [Candidatus Roizmanbacteria bacterium RIFCSPLOWO2_01_FULL_37_12]|uniref:DUF5660 domain-containing protein n=1 Tax=Candidatus Roizmanbacteria bacterium RIFCSPLOWO2_01_FULL_37_12 TaxID=1802056 RepID=A0A1F7IB77_9BACT|nr:MAG: hypothetical protein A2768_00455 [Candidatus Roizmanbacteria bacterium RIFCSPHIGHO2_01_FULL_37_16]OGK25922.1 MAG: hypothetical protein A3D76_06820 [Candidatus Roizmanbacteria bacterium RIFCSPHIGHO2_02_FULL_37_9b]OGK40608.1 MAG: hypothetical protein A2954_00330 [Candidatus Roizmanbacteria bacterium RIFCSPLOWO2_01_FULL_37_12]
MANIIGSQSNKTKVFKNQNTLESLKNSRHNSGLLDQFFGNNNPDYQLDEEFNWVGEKKKSAQKQRQEFSIFNYQRYYEQEIVKKEIKQLLNQIKEQIEMIKKADSALLQEVKDIQNLSLESLPENPGIYHIRFFEIILSILKTLRAKIGESRTWLQAMVSKRKKRGSLFAVRSKKKGTLYSMSQELSSARSIQ